MTQDEALELLFAQKPYSGHEKPRCVYATLGTRFKNDHTKVDLPAGTVVIVVMASTMGDVGFRTDRFGDPGPGYSGRTDPRDLVDWRFQPNRCGSTRGGEPDCLLAGLRIDGFGERWCAGHMAEVLQKNAERDHVGFDLREMPPIDVRRVNARSNAGGRVVIEEPNWSPSPAAQAFRAHRLLCGFGAVRAGRLLYLRISVLERLEAGALTPWDEEIWQRATELLTAAAAVFGLAMLRPPPARRCGAPVVAAGQLGRCLLDQVHAEHAPTMLERWPATRWPAEVLHDEVAAAGLAVDVDVMIAMAGGVGRLVGLSPRGRLWAQFFVPRIEQTKSRHRIR